MAKQPASSPPDLVILTTRVSPEIAAGIKRIAASEYRPVAAEIRRLIEERVAAFEVEGEAA